MPLRSVRAGRSRSAIIASLALMPWAFADVARAEDTATPTDAISLGAKGGLGGGTTTAPVSFQERAAGVFEFSARAGFASDYIYRGTTLSNHKPAVGAAVETVFDKFYAGATATSVSLPSQPALELTFGGGVRPKLGPIDFDLGVTYFAYPGELPGTNTEYWEAAARADTKIGELLHLAGGFAYSPNVSNTGAWSQYTAFGLGIEAPRNMLPQNVTAELTGSAGYFWFGNQNIQLGGFPLPSYLNWNVGVALSRGNFHFDLRYYDTNLSRESCFVYTGDPHAVPGGRIDPLTNPDGLVSGWCGATLVAKFWFALN